LHAVSFVVQRELQSAAEIAGELPPLEVEVVLLVVLLALESSEQPPPTAARATNPVMDVMTPATRRYEGM